MGMLVCMLKHHWLMHIHRTRYLDAHPIAIELLSFSQHDTFHYIVYIRHSLLLGVETIAKRTTAGLQIL